MDRNLEKRVLKEGKYFCEHHSTVREVAKIFNVSKSTVYNDLALKLKCIDEGLYELVKEIMLHNATIKHIRGGEATRIKYIKSRH